MIKSHCNNSIRGLSRKFKALSPVNQHAVALSLIEDGEVVLRVLGCPNYPMKKKWSSYPYSYLKIMSKLPPPTHESWNKRCVVYAKRGSGKAWKQSLLLHAHDKFVWPNHAKQVCFSSIEDPSLATFCEIVEKANKISHSFTQGLVDTVGLKKQPLKVYSMAKYSAIVHGNAEAFMKFAKESYKERIWDHAADIIIMQEAGGMVTDARGNLLNFSKELDIEGIDRGIVASCEATLHEKIIDAIDTNWTSSCL
ncbi:PAP-specific phosphatase HAL2-like [Arachis ipaensis]|nr:PAP-specific phosphatase HAL2-like [Arachis ipaensis]